MTAPLALAATVAAAAAIAVGVVVDTVGSGPGIADTPVYRDYGERIVGGDVPYRDFRVEYPPVALVPFVLPALVTSTFDGYDTVFKALMTIALGVAAALLVLTLGGLSASAKRTAFAVGSFLGGIALLGPFVLTRFDIYAAAVTLAAVCAIVRGRRHLGPVLLGVAIATKLYPAVLLPLLVARVWRRDGATAAMRALVLAIGTACAIYLPFVIVSPDGVARSVWRQVGRPLQIESLGGAVLLALHNAFGMPLAWASSAGSQNLTGTVASVASAVTTLAGAVALLLVWVRFARRDTSSAARFARYGAAATVAFMAFGKVASPQFLVWLLAAVVLVAGRRGAMATALMLVACALTRGWFPNGYWDLVKEFDPTASWLVLARDLVLVGAFAVLVVPALSRARESEPA